jgi:hypothetical protein
MENEKKNKIGFSNGLVIIIALVLMGIITNYMHSPDTNFIQDILLWIGGSVALLGLWFLVASTLEKGNRQ